MSKKESPISLKALLVIIFIIWVLSIFVLGYFFNDLKDRGTFGDTFGVINSLFSGLALAGIIYTIYLQKNELGLQRKELEYTRKELRRSADAHETSVSFLNEQLRNANIPILSFNSYRETLSNTLEIINNGVNNAFDLDIWVFKNQLNDQVNIESFREKYINQKMADNEDLLGGLIKENTFLGEDISWVLFERGCYHSLIPKSRILIPLSDYQLDTFCIEIYIQYRDSLNNNYGQYVFFTRDRNEGKPFNDESYDPKVPFVKDRIGINDGNELLESNIPDGLKKLYSFKDKWMYQSILTNDNLKVYNRWPVRKIIE